MLNIIVTIWILTFWGGIIMERIYIDDDVADMVENLFREVPTWVGFIRLTGIVMKVFVHAPIWFILDIISMIKH